jgi:hypothetical protein
VEHFPNATIAEYGTYSYYTAFHSVTHQIKAEILARGPVATGVNADPILEYTGGIVNNTKIWNMLVNHVVSIVGYVICLCLFFWVTEAMTSLECREASSCVLLSSQQLGKRQRNW